MTELGARVVTMSDSDGTVYDADGIDAEKLAFVRDLKVERRYDSAGRLPEQVGGETRDPTNYLLWVGRWGEPAADLTWSHAMYFVLWDQLNKRAPDPPPGGDSTRRPAGAPHLPKQATKQATPQPSRGPTEKEGTE